MSAEKQTLLEVNYVTDHDCGNYSIGEIDFGINGSIRPYLMEYGLNGKSDIIRVLAYLIYEVEREFRSIDDIEQLGQVENKRKANEPRHRCER
jgi:hypothetical protein